MTVITEPHNRQHLNKILQDLAEEIDLPPSKYREAKEHYEAVGEWLGEDDSDLALYDPVIHPHGSIALGTAIRPQGDEDYDVDAVCLLQLNKDEVAQQRLKKMIGDRLKHPHSRYKDMIDPPDGSRRCWTIKYADSSKFHLDVLPAIPDDYAWIVSLGVPEEWAKEAIRITDWHTPEYEFGWPAMIPGTFDPTRSNPRGYTEWFKDRMRVRFEERRKALAAMEKYAEVEDIEDYEVRTPLQRVIQLLKRHRDERYNGDDDKPISIIITTLAALAYHNEDDLIDTMLNVVPRMRNAIENREGFWWVPNPVNPQENFADKWVEHPRKQQVFFEWLDAVEREHRYLLTDHGFEKIGQYLSDSYGQRETSEVMAKFASRQVEEDNSNLDTSSAFSRKSGMAQAVSSTLSRFDVPHREQPTWPVQIGYRATINGRATRQGYRTLTSTNGFKRIGKHYSLQFEAATNVPRPYNVYWQVVNTGEEAERVGQVRGNITLGGKGHIERTEYTGFHWIECFIVKDGKLVARSGEFVVKIG